MLRSVFSKTIWDRRKSILWWAAGLVAMTLLTMASYPTVLDQRDSYEQLLEGAEGIAAIFGFDAVSELFDPAGYLVSNLYAQTLLIVMMVFTIGIGAGAIAGEEGKRTMDLLLAHPVRRRRVVLDVLAAMTVLTFFIAAAVMVVEMATNSMFELNLGFVGYLAANVGVTLLALIFGVLALAVGAVSGSRGYAIGISATAAVLLFVLFGLASSVSFLGWSESFNPISWFLGAKPLTDGFAAEYGWMVLTIAALTGIALWGFERRDVSV
jgi:ABC-2 type transport system permease protein